jgi:hypothetical protein
MGESSWWYIPIIPDSGDGGKEDREFEASLGFIVESYLKQTKNPRKTTFKSLYTKCMKKSD